MHNSTLNVNVKRTTFGHSLSVPIEHVLDSLTNSTARFVMYDDGNQVFLDTPATVDLSSPSEPELAYTFQDGDLPNRGQFKGEFFLTYATGEEQRHPLDQWIRITVQELVPGESSTPEPPPQFDAHISNEDNPHNTSVENLETTVLDATLVIRPDGLGGTHAEKLSAEDVTYQQGGQVAAENVQDAIAEVDTEKAHLAGRAGGQTLRGGTAASEELKLESTSNATKGVVRVLSDFVANGIASIVGKLTAQGDAEVQGDTDLQGHVTVGNTLDVTGQTLLQSNTSVEGTFGVVGETTLQSSLTTEDVRVEGRGHGVEVAVPFSSSVTIDLDQGNKFIVGEMTSDCSVTLTNGQPGQYVEIVLVQDATGGRAVTGYTSGAGVSNIKKPTDEDLAVHSNAGLATRLIGTLDADGSGGVVAYLRKSTASGWENL